MQPRLPIAHGKLDTAIQHLHIIRPRVTSQRHEYSYAACSARRALTRTPAVTVAMCLRRTRALTVCGVWCWLLALDAPCASAQQQQPAGGGGAPACTPDSGDCGWALVGGAGGKILCGGGQGVPVKSSGPANCAASCDGFPDVCVGQFDLPDCKAKCAADAACNGITWNSGTRDCMPKTSATACQDYATAPNGCAIPPGSATAPISD